MGPREALTDSVIARSVVTWRSRSWILLSFWIALKDSDLLWPEGHAESYAASLCSSQ